MKKPRALWASIIFVLVLVGGSATLLATGTRPVLGLDLEGGVSVILSAPEGTGGDVMDQALENIRNRIDAFGTAEPVLFVTGNTIEVQIPGLARGSIEERPKTQFCIADADGEAFGCFPDRVAAEEELEGASVEPIVNSVCLTGDLWGGEPPCFGSQAEADAVIEAIQVEERQGLFFLTGTGLAEDPSFSTRQEASAARLSIETDVAQSFCVQGASGTTLASDLGAACEVLERDAQSLFDGMEVSQTDAEFCVISSAGQDLGCSLSRTDAEARLQETGQERLLQVIGQTARLEEREVLAIVVPSDPAYDATPLTCATEAERQTSACSFEALKDQDVTFLDVADDTKFRLGPVEITGDAIDSATAVYNPGGGAQVAQGWEIQFDLTGPGADQFGEVTTRLQGRQLAIVVDQRVISAPTVQSAITGGSGVITGSFTESRAKDLATQLNAGALPVELTTQQVQTVSPTLGGESLRQGVVAGLVGLLLLAAYLLFYYRVLSLVAWIGMAIWAALAIGLVALAGRTIGYNLTLAGVAGLVISLGITADSYIVFFERLKDEVHGGKSPRAAVGPAFKRAYRTIVAADVVTALAALVLYITAISSVRGFALTLGVATMLDLFVVYFFKRPAASLLCRSERVVGWRWIGIRAGLSGDHEAAASPAISGGSE